MKTLLILTGPQGSGNHVWSKIFALHSHVYGWQALLDQYWIGHDQEPFAECWQDPNRLTQFDWGSHNYYVTSISNPYMYRGVETVPDLVRFAACAMGAGLKVKIAIIGRDNNIIRLQENRVRARITVNSAIEDYKKLQTWDPIFLSYELLHLYKAEYLVQLSKQLDFPIDYNSSLLDQILKEDSNQKYIHQVDSHWVDNLARKTSKIQL